MLISIAQTLFLLMLVGTLLWLGYLAWIEQQHE
jgi:hypothetical protein